MTCALFPHEFSRGPIHCLPTGAAPRTLCVLAAACMPHTLAQEDDEGGIKILSGLRKSNGYRRSWAVVIGINYENAKVPEPRGAWSPLSATPRTMLRSCDVLVNLYDYSPECVVLLKGDAATEQEIERALNEFFQKMMPRSNRTTACSCSFPATARGLKMRAIGAAHACAANVQFSPSGKLSSGGCLRMHKDLLPLLDASPAKHKLLILDCCHSGEIFSLHRKESRSEADDRRANSLFEAKGSIQAMASCRDRQRASDGISGRTRRSRPRCCKACRVKSAREDNDGAQMA